jgi:hypothetical protein
MPSRKLNQIAQAPTTKAANVAEVSKLVPTRLGDVLVLRTDQSFVMHVVGQVSKDGQQDFQNQTNTRYVLDHDVAVAEAKTLRVPGRRIFFRNIDTGDWSEISS